MDVKLMHRQGHPLRQIARVTGMSRVTVRRILSSPAPSEWRVMHSLRTGPASSSQTGGARRSAQHNCPLHERLPARREVHEV